MMNYIGAPREAGQCHLPPGQVSPTVGQPARTLRRLALLSCASGVRSSLESLESRSEMNDVFRSELNEDAKRAIAEPCRDSCSMTSFSIDP